MSGNSQRIETIAGLCKGPAIVDVGYDHGLLLKLLWERQPDWHLIGVEVDAGFAERAELPAGIDLRIGDGLSGLEDELTCAVFAGLGEERIGLLLERDWSVVERLQRAVVCASSIDGRLRPWLKERGWRCVEERLVKERGRLYLVSALEPGEETGEGENLAMGPRLFDGPDPLLDEWRVFWRRRFAGPR